MFCTSVRVEPLGSNVMDVHKYFIFQRFFFENLLAKFKFRYNLARMTGTFFT